MHGRAPQKRQAKAIAISRRAASDFSRLTMGSGLLTILLFAGLLLGAELLGGSGRLIGP